MTLEEYQAELRRISETWAAQNRELDRATVGLRSEPDLGVALDPAALVELDDAFQLTESLPNPGERGVRC